MRSDYCLPKYSAKMCRSHINKILTLRTKRNYDSKVKIKLMNTIKDPHINFQDLNF